MVNLDIFKNESLPNVKTYIDLFQFEISWYVFLCDLWKWLALDYLVYLNHILVHNFTELSDLITERKHCLLDDYFFLTNT